MSGFIGVRSHAHGGIISGRIGILFAQLPRRHHTDVSACKWMPVQTFQESFRGDGDNLRVRANPGTDFAALTVLFNGSAAAGPVLKPNNNRPHMVPAGSIESESTSLSGDGFASVTWYKRR